MPKIVEPLTDVACRQAKVEKGKTKKMFDGGGLFLSVTHTSKKWRLKFFHDSKESVITLGDYPQMSLSQARKERDEIKKVTAKGIHPVIERNRKKNEMIRSQKESFKFVYKEWFEYKKESWGEHHIKQITSYIENDVLPIIGDIPIIDITAQDVLSLIRMVENRGARTVTYRLLNWIQLILGYAVGTGRVSYNVCSDLGQFLKKRKPVKHYPHVSEKELPELLYDIHMYTGSYMVRALMKFALLTMVRPNEASNAEWSEFNFESKQWVIPSKRMKGTLMKKEFGQDHIVPLSNQVIVLLREIKGLAKKNSKYLFPSFKSRGDAPVNKGVIKETLLRLGYGGEQTAHGFRGLASTIMNEYGLDSKAIDVQLSHKPKEESGSELSYNHAKYLAKRTEIMQWWADYLDNALSNYKPITNKDVDF